MNGENKNLISDNSAAQTENDARLNLLYEIGRILASAETMKEAAPQILEAICRQLHFEFGELWSLNEGEIALTLESVWHSSSPQLERFAAESRDIRFTVGDGLPGKAWAQNAPVWVENLSNEENLPRRFFVEKFGLQSGFAFPVLLGEKFIGVFSFFSEKARRPDETLLQMFVAVGNHVGQFIKRERVESNLRESEERYRAFIEQSTEGIWRFELDEKIPVNLPVEEQLQRAFRDGYLAECNDAMARMYNFEKAEDLKGSRIADLLDMSDAANVEYLRAFFHSNYNLIDAESHEKDANGSDKYFLNSLVGLVEDGYLIRVWGTQRDITEQKNIQRFLVESEESYRIVAETASDAIIKINTDSRILFVNSAVERIFGFRPEEMLGQNLAMIIPEDLRELHRTGFRRYLETGEKRLSWEGLEIPARRADGAIFPLEISFGEYNENNKRFFIGIARDISERKQAESEREQLLVEAKQAREVAEAANRAKDEFIALVSHELRSPLNAMLGWTRILQDQKPDEKTRNYALDVIVRNARSQSRLIEDLLDIARVGKGKLKVEIEPTELLPILEAAIESVKPAAEAAKINFSERLDRAANFINGDADRLRQVFENLLSNAVKFTPEGGSVEICLERENGAAKVIVRDTGMGINAEFLPQIFERFKQADPSTTRRHGGLGIGLSLARDLVELHGGTISAESAGEDKGSTITVTLPLRTVMPINENSSKVEFMNSQGKLSGFWILAVDDEADARELVSFMLQINGAKVTTANSAVEALEILKGADGRLPDVLLSDISMPNESGYALLEKIRALPSEHGGQIPAVALTAFNRPEDREAAFDAGFQKHLGKPVEPEDLISAIIETAAK